MGDQVDLPSWGQAEKVERGLGGLVEGSTWSVTHMQQETQRGPSCPQSRWSPREERDPLLIFFLYLLAELNLGQFILKKFIQLLIQLICYVLDSSIYTFRHFWCV